MLTTRLFSILAPDSCLGCGAAGELVCGGCRAGLPVQRQSCFRCNRLHARGLTCPICRRYSALAGVTVAAYYGGAIKELITKLKYQKTSRLAEVAAGLMTPLLDPAGYDIITFLPTSAGHLRQRGYDQAALLARVLGHRLRLPYAAMLGRLGEVHQVGMNRQQRLDQVQGIFYAKRIGFIKDARILIVDDVMTTGASLDEAARILKVAGAKSISGAVIAKH